MIEECPSGGRIDCLTPIAGGHPNSGGKLSSEPLINAKADSYKGVLQQ